jgi:hypothetical protein
MTQEKLPHFEAGMVQFKRVDGTGENGGNRDLAIAFALFSLSTLPPLCVHPIHKAQLPSYMKLLDIPLTFVINFNELKLTDGVSMLIRRGANLE